MIRTYALFCTDTEAENIPTLGPRRLRGMEHGHARQCVRLAPDVDLTFEFLIGHLYSAISHMQLAVDDRPDFERGLQTALEPEPVSGTLIECVEVPALVGRRSNNTRAAAARSGAAGADSRAEFVVYRDYGARPRGRGG